MCAVATQGNPGGNKDYLKEIELGWSNDNITWETSAKVYTSLSTRSAFKFYHEKSVHTTFVLYSFAVLCSPLWLMFVLLKPADGDSNVTSIDQFVFLAWQ